MAKSKSPWFFRMENESFVVSLRQSIWTKRSLRTYLDVLFSFACRKSTLDYNRMCCCLLIWCSKVYRSEAHYSLHNLGEAVCTFVFFFLMLTCILSTIYCAWPFLNQWFVQKPNNWHLFLFRNNTDFWITVVYFIVNYIFTT